MVNKQHETGSENQGNNGQQRRATTTTTTTNSLENLELPNINDDEDVKKRFNRVRVLHNFRGSNNDELCMKKDDIITLTQTPSGGWWEGTLDGITGWFPSNYVMPITQNDPCYQQIQQIHGRPDSFDYHGISPIGGGDSQQDTDLIDSHLAEYRSIVMRVIEDSETQFIQSLQDAINHYLMPIYQYKILPNENELNAVLRSITEICSVHRRFLNSIEKVKSVPHQDNRIGGLFMQYAPQFKHAHFEYCSHHAKFVHYIEKYKKEICSFFAANPQPPPPSLAQSLASPSHHSSQQQQQQQNLASMPNVQITSLLSVSFRRLDKYPALLQELQRYTEENHVDRGDIQRAGFLYREISMSCLELRRRKEMELEVMLGNIKNFDNLNIENYGQIIKMEPVSILILPTWFEPKKDCYLVVFPKILMILSVGKEMTCFTFESMMKLEGAKLQPISLPPVDGSLVQSFPLEITGLNAHPFQSEPEQLTYVVGFTNEELLGEYYHLIQKQVRHQTVPEPTQQQQQQQQSSSMSMSSSGSIQPATGSSGSSSSAVFSPQSSSITSPDQPVPPTSLPPKPPQFRIQHMEPPPPPLPPVAHHRPPPPTPPAASGVGSIEIAIQSLPKRTSYWNEHMLTPHTPCRPTIDLANQTVNDLAVQSEPNDDMQLLNVIDAYHRKFPGSRGSRGSGSGESGKQTRNKTQSNQPDSLENQITSEMDPNDYVEIIVTKTNQFQRNPSARNARKHSLTMLANKINKLSLSSMDRDILYEIYDQLRVTRNEMSHLSEKVRQERRQRKRLQNAITKMIQQQQQNQEQTCSNV